MYPHSYLNYSLTFKKLMYMSKYNAAIPEDMSRIINNCTAALGGVGLIGGLIGPGADLVVIGPVWIGMTVKLADKAGQSMSEQTAKKLALAVCTGAGAFIGGAKIASTALAWLSAPFTFGASLAINAAANAGLNAAFTRSYGRACARFFLQTNRISDTDVAVKVLIALVGIDYGFSTPYDHLVS
jgi:uncharacterized protein (DUF697 family)